MDIFIIICFGIIIVLTILGVFSILLSPPKKKPPENKGKSGFPPGWLQ